MGSKYLKKNKLKLLNAKRDLHTFKFRNCDGKRLFIFLNLTTDIVIVTHLELNNVFISARLTAQIFIKFESQ